MGNVWIFPKEIGIKIFSKNSKILEIFRQK